MGILSIFKGSENAKKINLNLLVLKMNERFWDAKLVKGDIIEINEKYWNKGKTFSKLYIKIENNKAYFEDQIGRLMSVVNINNTNTIFAELKEICNVI